MADNVMARKIIAIIGSYRKDGIIEHAVDAILQAAAEKGAETETVRLIESRIEFCRNCRTCTQLEGPQRGACVHADDMDGHIEKDRGGRWTRPGIAREFLRRHGGDAALRRTARVLRLLALGKAGARPCG